MQVNNEIKQRKYSPKTGKTYIYWAREYILLHDKQHPKNSWGDKDLNTTMIYTQVLRKGTNQVKIPSDNL